MTADIDSTPTGRFALLIARRLAEAGFQAVWAGGCVRDRLLGLEPKDYDVATDAIPSQVRRLFRDYSTLCIGEAFGVVAVIGPREAGQVEVATFRADADYSDGRHPDGVVFCSAREDSLRRDFTINGMFYDPLRDEVIDYVGGREDLLRGMVRAIGDPEARLAEDKLRMLRAVRFAASFNFRLDEATRESIVRHRREIVVVSVERIAAEMRRMLSHSNRRRAMELLLETGLLEVLLPEAAQRFFDSAGQPNARGGEMLAVLQQLVKPSFPLALAGCLRGVGDSPADDEKFVRELGRRWKLSNDEIARSAGAVRFESALRDALRLDWPTLQRMLTHSDIEEQLQLAETVTAVRGEDPAGVRFCREKRALPEAEWNPPPLLTGDDLVAHGLAPGPAFRALLDAVRDAQLLGKLADKKEALAMVDRLREAGD